MRLNLSWIALGLFVLSPRLPAQTNPTPVTLNTLRTFPNLSYLSQWDVRAKEIREQILVSCGLWPMPEKTALNPKIFGRIEHEDYTVEKVYIQAAPGFYLGGNLFRPRGKGNGPFPGVLIPHGHWKEGRLVDASDASIPALGVSLARQGMVAFAFDMVGFNDTRFADWPTNKSFYDVHRFYGTNRTDELWNISLMGLQAWNTIRALDFLEGLPDVDKKRLGCTGASGGGTQTFMLGAVDERLAVQAPVCMVSHSMQGGCTCENTPGLRIEFSNMELAAAAAPRPQLLVAATGDWTKMTLEMEGPAIEKIYGLCDAKDKLRYVRFDFGHNYNQTSREAVYDWFGRWLNPGQPVAPKEQPFTRDMDLRVFPDNKLPSDAVTMADFVESQKQQHRKAWQALIPHNAEEMKNFKKTVEPLWRHTLQVTRLSTDPVHSVHTHNDSVKITHSSGSRQVTGQFGLPLLSFKTNAMLVILAGDAAVAPFTNRELSVLKLENYSTGEPGNQFTNFFTTYNRTYAQERVRDLIVTARTSKTSGGLRLSLNRVVLMGAGDAGLWSLLAAPEADVVVADCAQVDPTNDSTLLASNVFCPGLRNIGTFEGAALLAAPHPLLLHNVNDKFPTADLRAVYQALGASDKLRIESKRLSNDEIADWIAKVK